MRFHATLILIILLLSTAPQGARGDAIKEMHYTWTFLGKEYEIEIELTDGSSSNYVEKRNGTWYITMEIPRTSYTYYKRFPGGFRYSFNHTFLQFFLTSNDTYIQELADDFEKISREEEFDNLTKLNFVLSFVQEGLEYMDDLTYTGFYDYYKFPLETLVEGGGDCEDKSVLMATVAHVMGYDVVLFAMNITDLKTTGHVAVGVHMEYVNPLNPLSAYLRDYYVYHGKRYYYMETTTNGSEGIYTLHYYVGISPKEAGYTITNLTIIPYRNSWYRGYDYDQHDVKEIEGEREVPLFWGVVAALLLIYAPILIISIGMEKKKCPNCKEDIEDGWNYCARCGYWLGNNTEVIVEREMKFNEKGIK